VESPDGAVGVAHPPGEGPSHEEVEPRRGFRVGAAQLIEQLRGEMEHLAFGLRDGSRRAWLISIQADLTQDRASEKGAETNPLAIRPFEQHSD